MKNMNNTLVVRTATAGITFTVVVKKTIELVDSKGFQVTGFIHRPLKDIVTGEISTRNWVVSEEKGFQISGGEYHNLEAVVKATELEVSKRDFAHAYALLAERNKPTVEAPVVVEPWILKIVERALACEASTFPVKLQTYAQRRLLLDYFSPIFKETGYKTKLLINVVGKPIVAKEDIPVIQFTNMKSLIEQINGIKRATVMVATLEDRKKLIAAYQPKYKELGCFLNIEVTA